MGKTQKAGIYLLCICCLAFWPWTTFANDAVLFPAGIANSNEIDSNLNMNGHKILNALDVQTTGGPLTANSLVNQSYTTNKINTKAQEINAYTDAQIAGVQAYATANDITNRNIAEKYADDNDDATVTNIYKTIWN